jgi:hypothetical protein
VQMPEMIEVVRPPMPPLAMFFDFPGMRMPS